ncbi:MAG: PQQ-dependent sugar dehydrogenase [Gammaproteobacteria bacterium]
MSGIKNFCLASLAASFALACTNASATDTDRDGLVDIEDNCIAVANPDQRDSDGDLFGNACDADLNNDGTVNVIDLGLLRKRFFSSHADADLNGDGVVNVVDLGIMRSGFFSSPGPSGTRIAATPLQITRVYDDLQITLPLSMRQAPNDPGRWYMLERNGRMVSFEKDDNVSALKVVTDITGIDTGGEGGALGFDFHPDFANNGYVYVSYTAFGPDPSIEAVSTVSRLVLTQDPVDGLLITDFGDEEIVLEVNQPFGNHNGGNLLFGPEGYLYLGLGDGGSGGDPQNHAQRTETLLGAMLRIDVDVSVTDFDNGIRYYIPPDNPFAASPGCGVEADCPEIFAYGLRNPWRYSFDRVTGDLWVGDVGQMEREEINLLSAGGNYGWRCREGSLPFNETQGCPMLSAFTAPVHEYDHTAGFSVTGGYVYRGSQIPQIDGMYIFADYGNGSFRGIYNGDYAGELFDTNERVSSFAEDVSGEIYVMAQSKIFRLEPHP